MSNKDKVPWHSHGVRKRQKFYNEQEWFIFKEMERLTWWIVTMSCSLC